MDWFSQRVSQRVTNKRQNYEASVSLSLSPFLKQRDISNRSNFHRNKE